MKKNISKVLFFFILLHPLLDIGATYLKIGSISISTILRPIIPFIVFLYLTVKKEISIKQIIPYFGIYILYCLIHLWTYKVNLTPFAYGSVFHEAEYLFHYGYLFFLMFLYQKFFDGDVIKALLYMNIEILILLGISTLTNTGTSTYLEGFGNKGWFSSGGMLGSTMTVSICIFLSQIQNRKDKVLIGITTLLMLIYLCFFLGTRVSFYGSILIIALAGYYFLMLLLKEKKKYLVMGLCTVVLLAGTIFLFQYRTNRAKYLDDLKDDIIDPDTGEVIHIAYDILLVKKDILKENKYGLNFYQQEAIINLSDIAEKEKWVSTDMRKQQLYYHTYLYQAEGFDLVKKLFGNGYLSNMGALTLEMEEIALWYNFGIIGFILFFGYFLKLSIEGIIIGWKYRNQIDFEYLVLTTGVFYSFGVSLFSGHIFFHTSVMIVIVLLFYLYDKKIKQMKEGIS